MPEGCLWTAQARKAVPAGMPAGFPPESYLHAVPEDIPLMEIPLDELVPLFDWRMFRTVWGVKESLQLTREGRAVLDGMVRDRRVSVRLAARFFAARRVGEGIDLGSCFLPMLRQEEAPGRSLADFVPEDVVTAVEELKAKIDSGEVEVYAGELKDNAGNELVADG